MRFASLLLLAVSGCWVGIDDASSRACALPEHPCMDAQECFGDRCIPASDFEGWSQALHGFTSSASGPVDAVDVAGDEHVLSASLGTGGGSHEAVGEVAARLPHVTAGRIGGKILFPAGVGAGFTFCYLLGRQGSVLLRLEAAPDGFHVQAAPGIYSDDPVLGGVDVATYDQVEQALVPGRESRFEIRFRQGDTVQVWLDGFMLLDLTMSAFEDPEALAPAELRLGLQDYLGGTPATEVSAVLSDWSFVPFEPL
ncbi:MAG: hypothetical protein ACAI38_12700 [Myxococcota bacterium]